MPFYHTPNGVALLPIFRTADTLEREMLYLQDYTGAGNFIFCTTNGTVTFQLDSNGNILVGQVVGSDYPLTHTDPGVAGTLKGDAVGNLYYCYATDQWAKFTPSSTTF